MLTFLKGLLLAVVWLLLGSVLVILAFCYLYSQTRPDLQFWHRELVVDQVADELNNLEQVDLAAYLQREALIFQQLDHLLVQQAADKAPGYWSRFNPQGKANAENYASNWNRTVQLFSEKPKGAALLVHGLSDSPYSMRSVAELLHADQFDVLALRMPGHGTIPGALADLQWEDFQAAYQLGVESLVENLPDEQPLVLVGYSNGAALAVEYTLRAMQDDSLRKPDLLILISPAMQVSPMAAFAKVQRWISFLPGMEKLAWVDIRPEYDPYKYNSFHVNAGEQIYQLTQQLASELKQKKSTGLIKDFPRLLIFQSVVDATIKPSSVVGGLLDYLQGSPVELVLFDINRDARIIDFINHDDNQFLGQFLGENILPYDVTVLSNVADNTEELAARRKHQGRSAWQQQALGMTWPLSLYSLSHVALPFPANDPVYGANADRDSFLTIGSLEKRGEVGIFTVPMDLMARLRYNPFFPYMVERIQASIVGIESGKVLEKTAEK